MLHAYEFDCIENKRLEMSVACTWPNFLLVFRCWVIGKKILKACSIEICVVKIHP